MKYSIAVFLFLAVHLALSNELDCSKLDPAVVEEILGHQSDVDKIIQYVVNGNHKGQTFDDLQQFVDTFGPRMSGTQALEDAIDWVVQTATEEGFDHISTEDVQVPVWVRNSESATMLEPRMQKLSMLGLGSTIGTSPEGITAEVVAVTSFDELKALGDQVKGKIVVYNQPYYDYGQSVQYRLKGASEAAKLGAVAALVRSVTDFSIGSPHTGEQEYSPGVTKIPVASITLENAQMIYRLYKSEKLIKIQLIMGAENHLPAISRNTIVEHSGSERPQDLVVVSGHIDSWDVGVGAMDDGGGAFISYHANLVLRRLGLRALRTVQTVLFTAEEQGLHGGEQYFNRHKDNSSNYQILLESDGGTFSPYGLGMTGSDNATCIIKEILNLTAVLNATRMGTSDGGPDIGFWASIGVPVGGLDADTSTYSYFHHSEGDSIEVLDRDNLDVVTALWASVAYVAADLSVNLQDV